MTLLFEAPSGGQTLPIDLISSGPRQFEPLDFLELDFAELVEPEFVPNPPAQGEVQEAEAAHRSVEAARIRAMVDAARDEATEEAARVLEEHHAAALTAERGRVRHVLEQFHDQRERYFAHVEDEVVRLAIRIAERVLLREIRADGLHMEAVVRAALSRVQEGTAVVLRVPPVGAAVWAETLYGLPWVQTVPDAGLPEGECRLETEVGRVELGVAPQLREVERLFREMGVQDEQY